MQIKIAMKYISSMRLAKNPEVQQNSVNKALDK